MAREETFDGQSHQPPIKHGLMTERKPGGRFDPGVQHKSSEDVEETRGAHHAGADCERRPRPFQVVAIDGETLQPTARYMADTVNVGPGQRYDVLWTARRPGKWLIHCHSGHHTTNNNVKMRGGGGLMTVIGVASD